MDSISTPRAPWIQPLDRAGWSRIADRVIHGLCHDLNGRAGSLSGLSFLLESQTGDTSSVLPFLDQELAQLEEAVRLLRMLPDDATEAELLAPGEILPDLALMVRVQRGLEDVPVDPGDYSQAPALRMDRTLLIRSLVFLLTGAAERVVQEGLDGVTVRATGTGPGLRLEVWPGPIDGAVQDSRPQDLPSRLVLPEGVELWKEVLQGEGVEVREGVAEDPDVGIQLVFPSPSSSGSEGSSASPP